MSLIGRKQKAKEIKPEPDKKKEYKPLTAMVGLFLISFYLPVDTLRFQNAALEALHLVSSDSHNWVYCMLKHLTGLRKIAFVASAFLVGMGNRYGLLKYLVSLHQGPIAATRLFVASTAGKLKGLRTYRTAKRVTRESGNNKRRAGQTDEAT